MQRDFKFQKFTIIAALALLFAADAALAFYSFNLESSQNAAQDLAALTHNRDLLRADIKRAQDIREKIPAIQKDCDQFEGSLFPRGTGYSSISEEIGALAQKAGLHVESNAFREDEVKGRSELISVEIETSVEGSYANVVRFLNDLQRSKNMYAVSGLTAKSEAQNQSGPTPKNSSVKVTLHIKTYFRNA